ncbi:tautomerase family protein [Zhaonella formicivorans]|uniref:tautomerase family protein n=1 Tax=Zhaonella formicivorans TaxID=2528593 RepID=UPI0010D704CD|nr:tautomerase family protein [Zhaonella formicivorans]
MPIVTIDMFEGRSVEQKRELAKVLTEDICRICNCDASAVTIIIHDLPKTNIAKAGKLGSDPK